MTTTPAQSAAEAASRAATPGMKQVPFDALPNALRACSDLRRRDPELVRWIEDGHPTLTEAQHYARFGEDYAGKGRKRA